MFLKKPPHRIFDYEPRYYKPELDEEEKRKRRLKFKYHRKSNRKMRSPLFYIILAVLIVFIYLRFKGLI